MTDAERVLQVLLHDLRTPIGVAQGYLRLMRDGHLKSAADVEGALTKALHALGQTARLCQNAGEFLDTSDGHTPVTRVHASSLASQIHSLAQNQSLAVETGRIPAGACLAVAGSVAAICDAIVLVVSTAGRKRTTIHIEADEVELKFIGNNGALAATPATPTAVPFERWWAQGLALGVASHRIARSSGQIRSFEPGDALMVALPLEGQSA